VITIAEAEGVAVAGVEEVEVVVAEAEAKEEVAHIRENKHHHINLIEKKVRVVLFYDISLDDLAVSFDITIVCLLIALAYYMY